jgi:primosomal protein N' (replication factor Y)
VGGAAEGRRPARRARALRTPLEPDLSTVEVLPDSSGIDRAFHYLVPAALGEVPVGSIVRISLHGRRVRGWVVAAGTPVPPGVKPVPIQKVLSLGPPLDIVELCRWGAWRFAGRLRPFLAAASPPVLVRARAGPAAGAQPAPAGAPPAPAAGAQPAPAGAQPAPAAGAQPAQYAEPVEGQLVSAAPTLGAAVAKALAAGDAVLRLSPAQPRLDVVLEVVQQLGASPLVLTESRQDAETLTRRLRAQRLAVAMQPEDWAWAGSSQGPDVVVGTRNAALAPGHPAAVVVLDAHSEAYRSERAPTFDARLIAAERARRLGVPVVFVSPNPPLELCSGRPVVGLPPPVELQGWARLVTLDARQEDPRDGGYSPAMVSLIRTALRDSPSRPVVLVLNRKGRARLVSCGSCQTVQRCPRCGTALVQLEKPKKGELGTMTCPRCGLASPALCSECGAGHLRVLRPGASRAAEEVAALLGVDVGEVTATTKQLPATPVLVGTEAVLHRVRSAGLVGFLDFDNELLAPRFRAAEQALTLLSRASRLLGRRAAGGKVVVRTSVPDHPVVLAADAGDPSLLACEEDARRRLLSLPPYSALATVEGDGADAFVARLPGGVQASARPARGYLVRAGDPSVLADALAAVVRPQATGWANFDVRVEVEPLDL